MGLDLARFSSLSVCLSVCIFGLHGAMYMLNFFVLTSFSLHFTELSLVRLALDLVDQLSSFSAMTLLVGSSVM